MLKIKIIPKINFKILNLIKKQKNRRRIPSLSYNRLGIKIKVYFVIFKLPILQEVKSVSPENK